MKKNIFTLVALAMLAFSSCSDRDVYKGDGDENQKDFNEFSFSTTQDVTLKVNYSNMGVETSVYFEVYDQMPVKNNDYNSVKIDSIEPIYTGDTDFKGSFSKEITIPAYVKTLYIYTPAFYAQRLIKAEVNNGVVLAEDVSISSAASRSVTRASYTTSVIKDYSWKTYLGDFNRGTGIVDYAYKGDDSNLKFTDNEVKLLYKAHATIINSKKDCPQEYRSGKDMFISEDAEVAVNLLGGNTCWNSSMGYYYYKEGEKPKSLSEANVILIFPNTQDGLWENDPTGASKYKGVTRGTTVLLKYYPKIKDGNKQGETTVFPKGYRVGFVLATNTWGNKLRTGSGEFFATTSENLSVVRGNPFEGPRTAVYRYKNASEQTNSIIFSFEDHDYDNNFSDVVFTLKTNPIDAIVDIPEVNELKTTVSKLTGVYAYEDLWPNKGDYDMNDALVVSRYEKTYDASELDKGMYNEAYELKVLQNIAYMKNGLGVKLINCDNAIISLSVDNETVPYTKLEGDVLLLTDDIKPYLGKTMRVNISYKDPVKKEEAVVQPFIWRDAKDGKIWEMHIAQETPTVLVDKSFFGWGDDKSDVDKGIYYVRQGNYPFAFFLAGSTETDIKKLLLMENESLSIEKLYPGYVQWVESKGKENSDWYKK